MMARRCVRAYEYIVSVFITVTLLPKSSTDFDSYLCSVTLLKTSPRSLGNSCRHVCHHCLRCDRKRSHREEGGFSNGGVGRNIPSFFPFFLTCLSVQAETGWQKHKNSGKDGGGFYPGRAWPFALWSSAPPWRVQPGMEYGHAVSST